jgi:hypothetical protein
MNTTNSQEVHIAVEELKVKTIFWAQNYYFADLCNRIHRNRYIVQNVFAGRQVYDRYIDHDIINKSTYIFNMSSTPSATRGLLISFRLTLPILELSSQQRISCFSENLAGNFKKIVYSGLKCNWFC